ncbi:MAG: hypothetical protein H6738_05855 [Alphaproteobacteria bacterium]|nr:hypothetical protein [Alphaproteobacteria bacterium]
MWWILDAAAGTCVDQQPTEPLAMVSGAPFAEASGVAVSRTRDGILFLHGDKGDEPVILAVDRAGNVIDEHLLTDGTNEDWEDIAAAPCPDEGDCLYIGDIGDNDATRTNITVYVVREPVEGDDRIKSIRRYVGVYPDGPVDAETLMVHPCTGRIHVVTKADDGISTIFRFPFDPDGTTVLEQVDKVAIDAPTLDGRQITGGDWDPDGERVALRGSDRIFEWTTDPDRPNGHWNDPPTVLVGTTEVQGEGLAYGLDGEIVTVGEGSPIPMSISRCDELTPLQGTCEFPQTGRSCGCASGPRAPGATLLATLGLLRRRRIRSGR